MHLVSLGLAFNQHRHALCAPAVDSLLRRAQLLCAEATEQLLTAANNPTATKSRHYVSQLRGGTLDAASLSTPAAYMTAVRKR